MRTLSAVLTVAQLVGCPVLAVAQGVPSQALDPITYTVTIAEPGTHLARVEASIPAGGRAVLELMMPVWSPGFYRVEDYAGRVRDLAARALDGTPLEVEHPQPNRWTVRPQGKPVVLVSYQVVSEQRSVTTNWVGDSLAVLNGPPTFLTLTETTSRPREVRLVLPTGWTALTALDLAPDSQALHYSAPDYDALVDAPIVAGFPSVHQFAVDGSVHYLVDVGEKGNWDGARAAGDLRRIALATARLWGALPFRRYYFLNVFRRGGGGLEHAASSLLTTNAARVVTPEGYRGWLEFVSHEYFHAFNVKRLRPVELGPFDYERPPRTGSLWMAEGFTSYYGNLALPRAGIGAATAYLASLSSAIRQLQRQPGRRIQTVEQSSRDVWINSLSGVNPDSTTVSYYVKGEVIAFLLDARLRHATGGRRSLDDLMRLSYQRYSGARGYTALEFQQTAAEVAGVSLTQWFRTATASTEELDYSEALEWFGLRFGGSGDPATEWTLEVRPDASAEQRRQLREWLWEGST
jgi:predicted metalloprotease with PDZ domain